MSFAGIFATRVACRDRANRYDIYNVRARSATVTGGRYRGDDNVDRYHRISCCCFDRVRYRPTVSR